MTEGRLIAVVGPSGVGKDSVMTGIVNAIPEIHLVRRVITREPDLGGEDYKAVSVPEFHSLVTAGAFAVHWHAHGLYYGIPSEVMERTASGQDCLVNFSRKALTKASEVFERFLVLNITATTATLAKRLRERGREDEAEITRRLAEAEKSLPVGLDVVHLSNDGPLEETINRACQRLGTEPDSDESFKLQTESTS